MKKFLMAAVALTALTATPAIAADVDTTFVVNGTVTGKCTITAASPFAINGTGAINTDSSGNLAGANAATSSSVAVTCNTAGSNILVEKTALKNAAYSDTPANGYTNTIDFAAKATIAGVDYLEGADRPLGVVADTLTVTASNLTTGTNKPYAGSYSGTIKVTLKPGA
jgi:hypothetical protein